jgi:hypothetical protein
MGAGAWASGYRECDIVAVLGRDLNICRSHGDRLWLMSLVSRMVNMLRADPEVDGFLLLKVVNTAQSGRHGSWAR